MSSSSETISSPKTVRDDKNWFRYIQYQPKIDSPGEARNGLLIIVTLITAVTFQAGVNPPGGVWQKSNPEHMAGTSIYATSIKVPYCIFLFSNTLALSSCVLVILSLTYKYPFRLELFLATGSMLVSYGAAVFAITPGRVMKFRYILCVAAVPLGLRLFYLIYRKIYVLHVDRKGSFDAHLVESQLTTRDSNSKICTQVDEHGSPLVQDDFSADVVESQPSPNHVAKMNGQP